jgi:hypothetical protein
MYKKTKNSFTKTKQGGVVAKGGVSLKIVGSEIVDCRSQKVVRKISGDKIFCPSTGRVVGAKNTSGDWSGPHPWDDGATLHGKTEIELTEAQITACDQEIFDPNLS